MTVQVTYNGNPNHQRSFEVKVDNVRVADIPLAHLAFRDVAVNNFLIEPSAPEIANLTDKLSTAFEIAYADTNVAALKAEAFAPRAVKGIDPVWSRPKTELVTPAHAGAYLDLEFSIRNNKALDLLKPDATVQKIHTSERAEQTEKLGYII